jgi:glycosyltransferase involved in cell wall biosynthesis
MISVVMPAYNASKFIAPAIDSILNQTFQEFELIIVDDGSTDNTLEIVKSYLERDDRVQLIQSNHGGLSIACNLGISNSKYSWIARMDADDIALPQRFEKQINAARANPKVVAWGTYVHHMNSKGDVLSVNPLGPTSEEIFYNLRERGHVAHLHHPTVLLKKEIVLKAGGYNSEFEPAEDFELFDRLANQGLLLAIPEPLLLYRVHSQSVSMQRFYHQKLLQRCVVARHRARLAGNRELSISEFLEEYKKQPLVPGLKRYLHTLGQFYYRKAGLFACEQKYLQAGLHLSISAALNPRYSIPRIWYQVLSPKTRRLLDKSNISKNEE